MRLWFANMPFLESMKCLSRFLSARHPLFHICQGELSQQACLIWEMSPYQFYDVHTGQDHGVHATSGRTFQFFAEACNGLNDPLVLGIDPLPSFLLQLLVVGGFDKPVLRMATLHNTRQPVVE